MRVSVVIPVLNESERIAACIASVRRDYSCDDVEIIVVDGGSTDDTMQQVPREAERCK
ncbi:glycosyltransferase [Candidatus Bipolaricaulota bacterium]